MSEQVETVRLTTPCFVWLILDRVKWRLTDHDILDAISAFKEKTGQIAKTILLHPVTQKYELTPPDGVVVQYSFSVLAHEVFFPLSEKQPATAPPFALDKPLGNRETILQQVFNGAVSLETSNRIMQQPEKEQIPLDLIPVSKRGRPLKRGEVHRVTEWRRRQKMKQVVML